MGDVILFDVGGVIFTALDKTAVAARRDTLAHELGYPDGVAMWLRFYTGSEWMSSKIGGMTRAEMWDELLTPHGLVTQAAQNGFLERLFEGVGIAPAMRALIEKLYGRYQLAILSNANDYLEEQLARFDIDRYFDPIINSYRVGTAKPGTAIYEITLQQLGVPAENVYFIDNQERNTLIAESLGIASHIFTDVPTLKTALATHGFNWR